MGLKGKTGAGLRGADLHGADLHGADLHGADPVEKIRKVKVLILDVDGVLTDGRIIISDDGQETKCFNVRDGHGLKLVQRGGIEVILLTGRKSRVVERRPANSASKGYTRVSWTSSPYSTKSWLRRGSSPGRSPMREMTSSICPCRDASAAALHHRERCAQRGILKPSIS